MIKYKGFATILKEKVQNFLYEKTMRFLKLKFEANKTVVKNILSSYYLE
jgi:hypothetical protein